ncbi:transducin family protein / WD-40 repeat family protein isoform X2 [Wolffia australiana]
MAVSAPGSAGSSPGTRAASSWDSVLPGPPSRDNAGSADCSPAGLLAYGAGSTVVVADPASMQLVAVLSVPAPPRVASSSSPLSSSLSPFVTSVRWLPLPLPRDLVGIDDPSTSNLQLAVGDRQGRIAIWDLRSRRVLLWLELDASSERARLGVQDLCWVRSSSWLVASVNGQSLVALWDTSSGRCIWKYDASPEILSCLRRDPFDARHLCALSVKGFLLSARVLSGGSGEEVDVVVREHQVDADVTEMDRMHKEMASSSSSSSSSPASAIFPLGLPRFCFSPRWRGILLVAFPREMIVFDALYGTSLLAHSNPRGCAKIIDILADPDEDLVYCLHRDGKLSLWKRKLNEQAHILYRIEDLMPSIGNPVPSPSVLAVVFCQAESVIQNVCRFSENFPTSSSLSSVIGETPLDCPKSPTFTSKKCFLAISDDGRIWNWLLSTEIERNGIITGQKLVSERDMDRDNAKKLMSGQQDTPIHKQDSSAGNHQALGKAITAKTAGTSSNENLLVKISMVGQLHLLSSTVTTLAVPSPSLTAILSSGGNSPAAAVPLVALGTQSGNIDIIDVYANAVAESFSVHNSLIRGLRWLGNTRLVSFSSIKASEKGGSGFINRLVVTCVRTGLNRPFRVMQKPERAPIRALRASSSGRYLLIMFRDAPVEVWIMTKNPMMLRSLALPFTVMEWTLPSAPWPNENLISTQTSSSSGDRPSIPNSLQNDSSLKGTSSATDDPSESFAFTLANGGLGVFEVQGRRIHDFRPKWPSSPFVSTDGMISAMAYRLPHVVMGDRSGNIRWWDVKTGFSSSFNTYREGIRRIKFSPVVSGDRSRGRIAVLFNDNTFSVYDLDTQDPLANALLQPHFPGTLVLELDWLPTRTHKNEPLVLCVTGADSSFRLIEVNINSATTTKRVEPRVLKEKFRPVPLCQPILFPTPHALALRMILQLGVKPSWFSSPEAASDSSDLRSHMVVSTLPTVGDPVVPELLLKILEPYRIEGCLLDAERTSIYSLIVYKSSAARCAFAAAIFGEYLEAIFWLHLPSALYHLIHKSSRKSSEQASRLEVDPGAENYDDCSKDEKSAEKSEHGGRNNRGKAYGQFNLMAFERDALRTSAKERIAWHENFDGEDAIQNRVHELVSMGDLEAAVMLLLSTPPEGTYFYPNALRAVALSSAVSRSLHELAVKVVAANMVRTDKSLSGIHLLCAVGRYQEACSQLQDAGFWTDAATLAATHLHGSDYDRVLLRWADHILRNEHNIWRSNS